MSVPDEPLTFNPNLILAIVLGLVAVAGAVSYRERERVEGYVSRLTSLFASEKQPPSNVLLRLFLVSFTALYIEIVMIRWLGTEVRIFAFFQNLALIACFLGFGLGCYWSDRRKTSLFSLAAMTALIILVQAPIGLWQLFLTGLSNLLSLSRDASLWGYAYPLGRQTEILLFAASVTTIAAFLILLVVLMVPLGQYVGYYLDIARNPITAYSVNLLGSVAGLWAFAGMAFLWLKPEYWFSLAFLLMLVIQRPSRRLASAVLVLLIGSLLFLRHPCTPTTCIYWSPYQKLDVHSLSDRQYEIDVNNSTYMSVANTTPEFLAKNPEIARSYRSNSAYDAPFRFAARCDRVLIVGAGAGNDAAAALRNGANQVDAIDIDPAILFLGERLHPDKPYVSPKVHRILDDARAFLRRARGKYDAIVFGLLDSHTEFSGYSNLRIDNYVYTEEAFHEAKRLLDRDGILVIKFEVRAPWTWMGQRFYMMLDHVFGRPPIAFYSPPLGEFFSATVFVTSTDASLRRRAAQPELATLVANSPPPFSLGLEPDLPMTTDDWPYVYHHSRSIPRTYRTVELILLVMAILLVRRVIEPRRVSTWSFFSLGAGFLLIETQLISRLALYFGTTWLVNCVALTALLLMLVLANIYVVKLQPGRLGPYYVLLLFFLLANYLFPWPRLSYGARTVGILLSVAYALPVFFAGVVFAEMFRRCKRKSSAFGANIVGAVAGGLAQNLSFVVGIKALLLIGALCYCSAGLFAIFGGRLLVIKEAFPVGSAQV